MIEKKRLKVVFVVLPVIMMVKMHSRRGENRMSMNPKLRNENISKRQMSVVVSCLKDRKKRVALDCLLFLCKTGHRSKRTLNCSAWA